VGVHFSAGLPGCKGLHQATGQHFETTIEPMSKHEFL